MPRLLACVLWAALLPAVWAADLPVDTLVYAWRVDSLAARGATTLHGSPGDVLELRADSTFTLRMTTPALEETGTWRLRGDTLLLVYAWLPVQHEIDSLAYATLTGEPLLVYYHEGREVARQTLRGLDSERRTDAYAVRLGERGRLVLDGHTRDLHLFGRAVLVPHRFAWSDILRGMLGVAVLLGICWLFSTRRRAIDWRLVGSGMALQVVFALLVLKVPLVSKVFEFIAGGFVGLLNFTKKGSEFIFSGLVTDTTQFGYIFAFQILPTIIFFSALMSVLYYLGLIQRVVYAFAWVMSKTMRLSGAESLSAAGNIFLGQTESPLLIRPYLDKMTRSEIMTLMTGGMATIAGGVFAAYIGYLGGDDPVQQQIFATHLLTASIMSAPAAIVAAKMLLPETEPVNQNLDVPRERIGSNILDAISNGTIDGLRLAVNVGVMLMIFIAFMAMLNYFFSAGIGSWTGLNDYVRTQTGGRFTELNLQYLLGLIGAPLAWLLGVPTSDMLVIGQLLGEKTIINEFVAYASLGQLKAAGNIVYYKSVIIATYALCGFANFASIGIQIGGIGALAPGQRKVLSELGVRALLGGSVAAFLTAAIAGMLIGI